MSAKSVSALSNVTMGLSGLEDTLVDPAQSCPKCRRNSNHANPVPKRHASPRLVFTSTAARCECLPCRNYFNSCCKGVDKKQFDSEIGESDETFNEYMTSLNMWEHLFNESAGKQLRNPQHLVNTPKWILAIKETSHEDRVHLGNFWPKAVYERETGLTLEKSQLVPLGYLDKTTVWDGSSVCAI